ncbi:MAG: AAA family ATPase [Planctomycetes bacterium]|nr:AAA family ATPase [Planctomycetota bacterium]
MKSLALFNNKGGVGKTTLTFNLAHMASRLGFRVVVIDYDPQCNLSSIFLREEDLFDTWEADESSGRTVAACLEPVRRGKGEIRHPTLHPVGDQLWILPGHLSLSRARTLARRTSKRPRRHIAPPCPERARSRRDDLAGCVVDSGGSRRECGPPVHRRRPESRRAQSCGAAGMRCARLAACSGSVQSAGDAKRGPDSARLAHRLAHGLREPRSGTAARCDPGP